jgi:hypothetical protein
VLGNTVYATPFGSIQSFPKVDIVSLVTYPLLDALTRLEIVQVLTHFRSLYYHLCLTHNPSMVRGPLHYLWDSTDVCSPSRPVGTIVSKELLLWLECNARPILQVEPPSSRQRVSTFPPPVPHESNFILFTGRLYQSESLVGRIVRVTYSSV